MTQVRWLGDPVSEVLKYKKILLAWVTSGAVPNPLTSPPYGADDMVPTWNCLRDGITLLSFGKWWNNSGKLPQVGGGKGSEGFFPTSGNCAGIHVATLETNGYKAALETWSTGSPGGWTACQQGEVYDPEQKKCVPKPAGPGPSSATPIIPKQPTQIPSSGTVVTPDQPPTPECPTGQKWDDVKKECVAETLPTPPKPESPPSAESSSNTGLLVAGGLALAGFVGWLVWSGSKKSVPGLQENPSGGINLSDANLFGRDQYSEAALRNAFSWLTRTGAGRRMPMPIGWYQSHQIAALETIQKAAGVRGLAPDPRDESWYFRLHGGEYQVWDYEKKRWVGLDLTPRKVFEIADRKGRGL